MTPAYERDAYLTTLDTVVEEVGSEGGRPFAVVADTVLYPEGGGQPCDHGWLGDSAVTAVARRLAELAAARTALLTAGADANACFALVVADSRTAVAAAALAGVERALAGRGGGRGRLFQGRASALAGRAAAVAALAAAVDGAP